MLGEGYEPDPLPPDRAAVLWLSLFHPSFPHESQRLQQLATYIFLSIHVVSFFCHFPLSIFHTLIFFCCQTASLSSFHPTVCHTSRHPPTVCPVKHCFGSCSHTAGSYAAQLFYRSHNATLLPYSSHTLWYHSLIISCLGTTSLKYIPFILVFSSVWLLDKKHWPNKKNQHGILWS